MFCIYIIVCYCEGISSIRCVIVDRILFGWMVCSYEDSFCDSWGVSLIIDFRVSIGWWYYCIVNDFDSVNIIFILNGM